MLVGEGGTGAPTDVVPLRELCQRSSPPGEAAERGAEVLEHCEFRA